MFRYLLVPVLMAVVLVPDWATAIGRRNPVFARRAQPVAASYPVQYSQPVYYSAPPVHHAMPSNPCCPPSCQPTVGTVPAKPTVVPERMEPVAPAKPKTQVQTEPLAQPRAVEPDPSFKPVVGTETLPAMKDPFPVLPVPKPKEPETLPVVPAVKPKDEPLPPLKFDLKKDELPKLELPKLDVPSIPPLAAPTPIEPLPIPNVVKSSPLNAEPAKWKIDRFPVDGAAPASPDSLRLVTFYNFSGRELSLTIAGKDVTVPSKHSVEAQLPTAFEWKIGAEAQADGAIPPTAPGLDIVIGK